ncbi:MAG: hypothetical protein BWK76_00320 [Desulfobulbaceae bacterium A2]|nr:MAG: hypothetical protein BWK76_00320 [Desulfobulbaceae bacterium A2]
MSKEKLTGIILSLAKEVRGDRRGEFLADLLAMLSNAAGAHAAEALPAKDDLLKSIVALKESILEREKSIEDGSYWDEEDDGYDAGGYYYSEDYPDLVGDDQQAEVVGHFQEADRLFLLGRIKEARAVYSALFDLVREVSVSGFLPDYDIDLREARARYCRCVYELADVNERVPDMLAAMEVDLPKQDFASKSSGEYPGLQDVIESQPGDLPGFAVFLPAWEKALARKGHSQDRLAELRLEALSLVGDQAKIGELARKWHANQPLGYLYWLQLLSQGEDWCQVKEVAREALAHLSPGDAKEQIANFLLTAGQRLGDACLVLDGKREQFMANICDANLLALVNEADRQGRRLEELASVCVMLSSLLKKEAKDSTRFLLVKALLMAGELESAFLLFQGARGVALSLGNGIGLLFAGILYCMSGKCSDCSLAREQFQQYANQTAVHSNKFLVAGENEPTCSGEIRLGLDSCEVPAQDLARYSKWARGVGDKSINHIVSSKSRSAYDQAAGLLCAMAEALAASGQPGKAQELLRHYYRDRFSRFTAFRREVKKAVDRSSVLKKLGQVL